MKKKYLIHFSNVNYTSYFQWISMYTYTDIFICMLRERKKRYLFIFSRWHTVQGFLIVTTYTYLNVGRCTNCPVPSAYYHQQSRCHSNSIPVSSWEKCCLGDESPGPLSWYILLMLAQSKSTDIQTIYQHVIT